MSLERRVSKLEASLPGPKVCRPIPEDLRRALIEMGCSVSDEAVTVSVGPRLKGSLSPELSEALSQLARDLVERRFME